MFNNKLIAIFINLHMKECWKSSFFLKKKLLLVSSDQVISLAYIYPYVKFYLNQIGLSFTFITCLQSRNICYVLSDKKGGPKSANDIKLINAGKILENNKTVGQCRTPFGDLPITMHALVQVSLTKTKTGNFHVFFLTI